eukprot:6012612-Amphidinium_carterae.1
MLRFKSGTTESKCLLGLFGGRLDKHRNQSFAGQRREKYESARTPRKSTCYFGSCFQQHAETCWLEELLEQTTTVCSDLTE